MGVTVSDQSSGAGSALASHHPLGVSTGVFADLRSSWQELVVEACAVSTYAVELSALSADELSGLVPGLAGKAESAVPLCVRPCARQGLWARRRGDQAASWGASAPGEVD